MLRVDAVQDADEIGRAALGEIPPHLVQPAEMALAQPLTDDCRAFGFSYGVMSWGQWSSMDWDRETDELYVFGNLMAHHRTGGQIRIRKFRVNRG